MPVKPNRSPTKSIRPKQTTETTSPILAQHGSPLVQLPSELLTHLTAYLDPVALNILASVCRLLNAHVGQDNTWRCAFLCHFLGVPPDPGASIDHPKLLLLRRVERSWRAEFQKHWVMTKRWERSKAPTVTHRPHRVPISTMHVMQAGKNVQGTPLQPANCALLSASLTTGNVMRSYPFNGKIVRGHFDASSTTTALGLGLNPNLQEAFSNVSALALASTGGTGLVIWGLRSGGVAVTVAPRAMDAGCSARMIKCTLSDAHRSLVENVCVNEGPNGSECFATSSTDGSVKMWTLPTSQRGQVSCVWTGGYTDAGHVDSGVAALISVPCIKIAISVSAGVVAAGYADGTVLVWFGVSLGSGTVVDPHNVTCVRIPPPSVLPSALATLRLHAHSSTNVSVLVHHSTEGHFHKLKVDKDAGLVKRTRFGGGLLGVIEVVVGEFAKQAKEDARTAPQSTGPSGAGTPAPTPNVDTLPPALVPLHLTLPRPELGSAPRARSFVVAGDSLGRMCIWDWDAEEEEVRKNPGDGVGDGTEAAVLEVPAAVVWDAVDGEGISAVAWSDVVVAIGTTRGHTLIFDSLTQQLLRRIQSPSPVSAHHDREAVSQIAIDGDVLLVAVDGQVLAWQARKEAGKGPNGPGKSGKGKKSTGGKSGGTAAKWQQRNELNTEISHSLNQLKHESAQSQPALRRARAQAGTLSEMGMDESDAVQYLMMLSRDEDDARRAAEAAVASANGHEGEMGSGSSGIEGHDWPNRPGNKLKGPYGSPTNSTHSSAPSASTSPSSRRSGPSVYIPANGRPRTSVEDDIPDVNPYLSRSPYGSYHSGRSYRSNESGGRGGAIIDEDEELRMVLEMSLLEQ